MINDIGYVQLSAGLLVYLFFSTCLYRIALKTGINHQAWWGWVPVLQVLLMLKVAGVPWWWIFLLLIPLANIVVGILVWIKIAQRLNKPGWFGVLMFIPGVDLFVLGYLAFSK